MGRNLQQIAQQYDETLQPHETLNHQVFVIKKVLIL
jgi:hypothetical protein